MTGHVQPFDPNPRLQAGQVLSLQLLEWPPWVQAFSTWLLTLRPWCCRSAGRERAVLPSRCQQVRPCLYVRTNSHVLLCSGVQCRALQQSHAPISSERCQHSPRRLCSSRRRRSSRKATTSAAGPGGPYRPACILACSATTVRCSLRRLVAEGLTEQDAQKAFPYAAQALGIATATVGGVGVVGAATIYASGADVKASVQVSGFKDAWAMLRGRELAGAMNAQFKRAAGKLGLGGQAAPEGGIPKQNAPAQDATR
jgi:hypothetical protein